MEKRCSALWLSSNICSKDKKEGYCSTAYCAYKAYFKNGVVVLDYYNTNKKQEFTLSDVREFVSKGYSGILKGLCLGFDFIDYAEQHGFTPLEIAFIEKCF